MLNLSNFSFKHVEGSGYDPIHTIITIPRNDGKGVFEIRITGNLDDVEVVSYVNENKGLIKTQVISEYKKVLKSYKPSKLQKTITLPYSSDRPEWKKIGTNRTSHGKDIKLKKVNENDLGKEYVK